MKIKSLIVFLCMVLVGNQSSGQSPDNINDIKGLTLVREVQEYKGNYGFFSPNGRYRAHSGDRYGARKLFIFDTMNWEFLDIESCYASRQTWLDDQTLFLEDDDNKKSYLFSLQTRKKNDDESAIIEAKETLEQKTKIMINRDKEKVAIERQGNRVRTFRARASYSYSMISPTGRYVVFCGSFDEDVIDYEGNKYRYGMVLYDLDQDIARHVTSQGSIAAMSSDEKWLLYVSYEDFPMRVWDIENPEFYSLSIMDVETGQKKVLVPFSDGSIIELNWSSSGLICFTRNIGGEEPRKLYFYTLDINS